jgi:hypothetical protein
MENIDLATIIQETVSTFCRKRMGGKPPVFVTLSPALTQVPWKTRRLKEFVRGILYECLLANDSETAIQVKLRKRFPLKDVNAFLGIDPSYWVQLRIAGRGLRILEPMVEEFFADIGYRCEEWLGIEDWPARLGIFGPMEATSHKLVFAVEVSRGLLKADLLLPVFEDGSPYPSSPQRPEHNARNSKIIGVSSAAHNPDLPYVEIKQRRFS